LQGKYSECLMEATGYGKENVNPRDFTLGINKTFQAWEAQKKQDIMSFRDHSYASLVTGTMSPKPSSDATWLANKWDDDIAFYLQMHKQ
jgi:trimethylamine monooxygenase